MRRRRVSAVQPGECIGVISPYTGGGRLDGTEGKQVLEEMGFAVQMMPSAQMRKDGLFLSSYELAKEIHHLSMNPDIKAILCLGDGQGINRVIAELDYTVLKKNPKLFIGRGTATGMHIVLGERCGAMTAYGPMLCDFHASMSEYTKRQFRDGVACAGVLGDLTMPGQCALQSWKSGSWDGVVVGGRLGALASLAGTPYELKGFNDILLLEEYGREPWEIEEDLYHLSQNGLFNRARAVVLGDFSSCKPKESAETGVASIDEVLHGFFETAEIPVLAGFAGGAVPEQAFLPLGVESRIVSRKQEEKITILVRYAK